MSDATFEYRPCERKAFCRDCDKVINKGDMMVSGYSWRNTGMSMHFHPECVENMFRLISKENE